MDDKIPVSFLGATQVLTYILLVLILFFDTDTHLLIFLLFITLWFQVDLR